MFGSVQCGFIKEMEGVLFCFVVYVCMHVKVAKMGSRELNVLMAVCL